MLNQITPLIIVKAVNKARKPKEEAPEEPVKSDEVKALEEIL